MGAKITGDRWNETSVALFYAARSCSLACLETSVHLNAGGLPLNRHVVVIDIPNDVWNTARSITPKGLATG